MKIYGFASGEYDDYAVGPFFSTRVAAEEYISGLGYGSIVEFDMYDTAKEGFRADLDASREWEGRVYGGNLPESMRLYHAKLEALL